MKKIYTFIIILLAAGLLAVILIGQYKKTTVEVLVHKHAQAWETGDMDLFLETIHEDIIFAYPGRRLAKDDLIADFEYFAENFSDTKIYIHNIVFNRGTVGVEWQFATTDNEGDRSVVSDAIIGKIKNGKIISWKEYLDGRVSRMQKAGDLPLEEGLEPFPWPIKPKI